MNLGEKNMERERHFTLEKREDGVLVIWMDLKGEKVNKVGPGMIGLFEELMDDIEGDGQVKAVVLTSRKEDFIAGADIEAFLKVQEPGDWQPVTRKAHAILDRIERSPKPLVAAIHGSALGAGLEIALACSARLCSDDPRTKLALPEVKLGLLPGGGGTQRLPRLIGLQSSLDIMLTGKNTFAGKAKKIGLVDRVTHRSMLISTAARMALELAAGKKSRKIRRRASDRILEGPMSPVVFRVARKKLHSQTHGNYPAPERIIDCVEAGWRSGRKKGLEAEVKYFEELLLSPESRELIQIFFAMTARKKNPMPEAVRPVNRMAVLGAGFMGAGIAEVSMTNGFRVLLKDVQEKALIAAYKNVYSSLARKVRRRALKKVDMERTMGRMSSGLDYSGFEHADIVVEAVFEDMDLKHRMLRETEKAVGRQCIFASNTSALPISDIAAAAEHPDRVIGMHYFSPVPKMPLLEIIRTDRTADWVVATCYDIGVRQGKTCIVVKDGPGFYTTRILAPLMNEAMLMLDEGASIEQIDREMNRFGFPVGPVTLIDEVGIDVAAHIMSGDLMKSALAAAGREMKISYTLLEVNKAGYKGRKNRKGFYQYDSRGKKLGSADREIYGFFGGKERKQLDVEEIQLRCALMMVNEAAYCLQEDIISSPGDGDIGAVFGLGFPPFRGGPFRYLDSLGISSAVELMEDMAARYGPRFLPAPLLKTYASAGRNFY